MSVDCQFAYILQSKCGVGQPGAHVPHQSCYPHSCTYWEDFFTGQAKEASIKTRHLHVSCTITRTPTQPHAHAYIYTHTHTCSPEFYYSCGRTSQIWQLNSSAMTASPSDRISYLARHKTAPAGHIEHRPQFVYGCGRTSSIWQSQPRARSWSNPVVRPRTAELARPKQTHSDYRPNRQVRNCWVCNG